MSQSIEWVAFNKSNIKRLVGGNSLAILVVRRDGKGYYGTVSQVTAEYVEIGNGDHVQNLYYFGAPMVLTVVDQPPAPSYKLGQPRLKLEGKSDGGE